MCRPLHTRDRSAMACVVAGLMALTALCFGFAARGQVPGPEVFAKQPQTPLELWDAADYLVRTGQVRQAVPYLEAFLRSNPDDATLLEVRDRYGAGSILRLEDYPETRSMVRPLIEMLNAATRRNATRADRIERFIAALTKTAEEQEYAVEQLRQSGPYAVPFLIQELQRPGLSLEGRALLVHNIGRLDRSAVPPLIATLDSTDAGLVANAADALGLIGDPRAVPQLMYLAATMRPDSASGAAARRAIALLTGRPFESQPTSPLHVLTCEARRYYLHEVPFPSDPVEVWVWDEGKRAPVPVQSSRSLAEGYFGLKLAHEALQLVPTYVPAQVMLLSLALEKAVERVGFAAFPTGDPSNTFATAVAAGPRVLSRVVRMALDDRKYDLAAAAVMALGVVADPDALPHDPCPNPLVEALTAPDRRVQFAAARALVALAPRRPFPGSSLIIPVLARFVGNQAAPRAVVIDGNPTRGGMIAGELKALGYDPILAPTGDQGFRAAAETADVELILIDPHLVQGDWRLIDTVSNLRADARTAGIPIFIYGPQAIGVQLDDLMKRYPGIRFLVTPISPALLEQQLGGRPAALSESERVAYAREAAALLARLGAQPDSPIASDFDRAEPALVVGLNLPATNMSASTALGGMPVPDAQRALADVVLNPSQPAQLRLNAAAHLARNIQHFGPLVTADQEARLLAAFDQEPDPTMRTGLAAVLGALRPNPLVIGQRLQRYGIAAAPPVAPTPAPGTAPPAPAPAEMSPPAGEAQP